MSSQPRVLQWPCQPRFRAPRPPHWFKSSLLFSPLLQETRTLARSLTRSETPSQDLFATKFVFLFSLSTVTLLCSPCYGLPRFVFCESFHAVLLAFSLNINFCVSSSICSGLCLLDMWCWGSAVVATAVSVRRWGAFLCMLWVHVPPRQKITQTLHHLYQNNTFQFEKIRL